MAADNGVKMGLFTTTFRLQMCLISC